MEVFNNVLVKLSYVRKRAVGYRVCHSPWTKSVLCVMTDLSAKCEAPGVRQVTSVPPAHNWNWINQCSGASVGKGVKMKMIPTAAPSPEELGSSCVKWDYSRREQLCLLLNIQGSCFYFASCLCIFIYLFIFVIFCPIPLSIPSVLAIPTEICL